VGKLEIQGQDFHFPTAPNACGARNKTAVYTKRLTPPLRTQAGDSDNQPPVQRMERGFSNATCIATLLDRLLHHADVALIEGDSYRVSESEQETAARRRKK